MSPSEVPSSSGPRAEATLDIVKAWDAPAFAELEPLASSSLRRRFPHLPVAMDTDQVIELIQAALFAGTGLVVEACAPPKADTTADVCRLQYSVTVRSPTGTSEDRLVIGIMFADTRCAARYQRETLAPIARRHGTRRPGQPRLTAHVEDLGLALSVFPVSGSLPTLVEVTDNDHMRGVLRVLLGEELSPRRIELVKLRRTPRCVLRYHLDSGDEQVVYGKVGSTVGDHVWRGLGELASRLDAAANGSFRVPAVVGHQPALELTLLTSVPGSRADLSVEGAIDALVTGAASAAAAIHMSGVEVGAIRTVEDEFARATGQIRAIRGDAPVLAAWLTGIMDWVASAVGSQDLLLPRCAHGDFTVSQLLFEGTQVGILDFDGLCRAEPALDLGRFTSYLLMALAKLDKEAADQPVSRFVSDYRILSGTFVSEDRVRLVGLVSLVLMATRSWQQLKAHRLRLVCSLLDREMLAMRG